MNFYFRRTHLSYLSWDGQICGYQSCTPYLGQIESFALRSPGPVWIFASVIFTTPLLFALCNTADTFIWKWSPRTWVLFFLIKVLDLLISHPYMMVKLGGCVWVRGRRSLLLVCAFVSYKKNSTTGRLLSGFILRMCLALNLGRDNYSWSSML